ncbi:MAG: ROK family protein [Candidatus Omnitrophica bacterium]|nr:ROK family protein [Candidatus Omnitrophota bacterium]MCB9747375.1 ROK family protein [Candidatus Omnitrophota bacterium]
MNKLTIGVDIGGTNIKIGLITAAGKITARTRLSTRTLVRNKQKLINALIQKITDLLNEQKIPKSKVLGIGIGLPGLINPQKGIVNLLPNIPGWKNVPLKKILEQKLKLKTYIDNDVNVIALGEWKFGAGKGYENLVMMTLGTGVGGGLILNNALYRGEGFVSGEIGHMLLNEKGPHGVFDGYGYFEHYVGNRQLREKAIKMFKKKDIQLEEVFTLANKGNRLAQQFWNDAAVHIGNVLVDVINLLNPRLIIIGGGVSNNFKFLAPGINKIIKQRAMEVHKKMVKVVRAKLGDDAGIIGAQVLVKESRLVK